ncbi:MAG: S41 family peptidase [Spirochaetales bacterium]|nr:MAG: S41 family peptidase [Spirochaetales bacterium]
MEKKMKNKVRFLWVGTSALFAVFLIVLTLAPAVLVQSDKTPQNDTETFSRLFQQVFDFVKQNYVDEIDSQTLFEGAMKGMFDSLKDPYSTYLTVTDMQDLTDTTSGKFGGVGMYITKPVAPEPGTESVEKFYPFIRIVAPIEGTPAAKAGINAGDYIVKIENESTEGMSSDDAVEKLRGTAGSSVTITIMRNESIVFPVTLVRAVIEVPTVKYAMMPGNIGYIRIIQFTPLTDDKVKEGISYLKSYNYKGLVIDVRQNPGGLLTSVVETADFFLSEGTIVSTRSRIPSENAVFSATPSVLVPKEIPIVVLIDKGSASASEILAGALKDTGRALLLGEKSYGKGSVQQVKSIGAGGFKLTMSRYYTPSGVNIDKIGIQPDKEVKERDFTAAENEAYKKLIQENLIRSFVEKNPNPSGDNIISFVAELHQKGISLEDRLLRRLIRNEVNRTNNAPPIFDLEFDLVLQEAVKTLQSGGLARP